MALPEVCSSIRAPYDVKIRLLAKLSGDCQKEYSQLLVSTRILVARNVSAPLQPACLRRSTESPPDCGEVCTSCRPCLGSSSPPPSYSPSVRWHFVEEGSPPFWQWRRIHADEHTEHEQTVSGPFPTYGKVILDAIQHGFDPEENHWVVVSRSGTAHFNTGSTESEPGDGTWTLGNSR